MENQIVLGPDYKGCWCLMHTKEAPEVRVGAIHDVDGARLDKQFVENLYIVHLAFGNDNNGGNGAAQIEKRMQFDCRLRPAKVSPRKEREAEIDNTRIESIDRFFEHQTKIVVEVEPSGLRDQHLSKIGIDAPIANLICICQGVAGHFATDAHVIELSLGSAKAGLDVAQALAVRQLCECHATELIAA